MFLHGGLLHILFNAWALYALGPETERIYGTARFLAIYFPAGLAGGVASYAFSPYPAVGAVGRDLRADRRAGGVLLHLARAARRHGTPAARQPDHRDYDQPVYRLQLRRLIDNFAHRWADRRAVAGLNALAPRFEVDERLYPPQASGAHCRWAGPGRWGSWRCCSCF